MKNTKKTSLSVNRDFQRFVVGNLRFASDGQQSDPLAAINAARRGLTNGMEINENGEIIPNSSSSGQSNGSLGNTVSENSKLRVGNDKFGFII